MRTDPQFLKNIVFAGSLAVLAAGLAREAFVLEYGVGTIVQDLRQFDLDSENSVPSWWGSVLLLTASCLLYALGAQARALRDRLWPLWAIMAFVFLLLSIDEAASFHEGTIEPLKAAFGFHGALYYAWVVPAIACLAALGVILLPLLRYLPQALFIRFAAYGGIFVFGAVGMEMVGGWLDSHGFRHTPYYALSTSFEEMLELLGASMFVVVLLDQFDPTRAHVGRYARRPNAYAPPRQAATPRAAAGQFPLAGAE